MTDKTSASAGASGTGSASAADLTRQLSQQVSLLVRDELKLAQLEMTRKGKQAGVGAGLLGGGGVIALYGVGCLVAAAVLGISTALAGWLAALIVGAVVLAASGTAALAGKARLSKAVPPVPQQAAEGIKADVEEIRERAHP